MSDLLAREAVPPLTDAARASAIGFRDITKAYAPGAHGDGLLVLGGVTLDIAQGEFVSLLGPSGCGKSTLLNLAAGLVRPTSGAVTADGVTLQGINGGVGYLTQSSALLPWRSVERNVALPLEIAHVAAPERHRRVREMLELVGLARFARHYPAQLSGGMQRRLALARMLVHDPATLLMDEPFGALDAQLRGELQRELLRIWEHDRKTVLFVTHDIEEAIVLSDRVIVLAAHPGRILHEERVALARPRDVRTLREDPAFKATLDRLHLLLEAASDAAPHP